MKIIKIEEIEYDDYIYTPQIEDNENYLIGAKGILSKNCQNFDIASLRTIISRVGKNSIVIAMGSNNQIDSQYLTKNTNALTFLMDKANSENESNVVVRGVKLTNVMRSKISEWADLELYR